MALAASLQILNYMMLAGIGVGAGVAGYNNSQNSCEAVKNAVEILKKAKDVQTNWNNALSDTETINKMTISQITQNYLEIEKYQNKIAEAQQNSKKNKRIIVALGFSVIFILFFYLLYRYFNTRIQFIKSSTKTYRK